MIFGVGFDIFIYKFELFFGPTRDRELLFIT